MKSSHRHQWIAGQGDSGPSTASMVQLKASVRGTMGSGWAKRIPRATAIALAAFVATAAIAFATIPNGNVIEACYTRSGGSLRVIDRTVTNCTKNETSLAWNVQGPAGPQGEAGPAGPAGPAGINGIDGVNGVSSGFAGSADSQTIDTGALAGQVVISKTVPPGKYVLVARVRVSALGITTAHCFIPGDRTFASLGSSEENMALTAGVTHPGGPIELRCAKATSSQSSFQVTASFTGIQVDTLN